MANSTIPGPGDCDYGEIADALGLSMGDKVPPGEEKGSSRGVFSKDQLVVEANRFSNFPTPPWEADNYGFFDDQDREIQEDVSDGDEWFYPDLEQSELGLNKHEEDGSSGTRLESPLVYRYFGRNQARRHSAGSIPFILLGPHVDHWKAVGQELSARGFSVIACERTVQDFADEETSANVLLELLDALRWGKAVIVGCDTEVVLAMQAAAQLAPDRIVGLVLCGNLHSGQDFCQSRLSGPDTKLPNSSIDRFLGRYLDCPYTIVWDGDDPTHQPVLSSGSGVSESSGIATDVRSLVIGGGIAPHRRRPKLFSWVLTRFVEQRIAPRASVVKAPRAGASNSEKDECSHSTLPTWKSRLGEIVAPESRIVIGRLVATVLLYGTAMKVCVVQYHHIRDGIDTVSYFRQYFLRGFASTLGLTPWSRNSKRVAVENNESETSAQSEIDCTDDDEAQEKEDNEQKESIRESNDWPPNKEPKLPKDLPFRQPIFFLDQVVV